MFGIENLYTKDDAVKTFGNIKKQKPLQGCFIQKKNERYNAPIMGKFPIGQSAPKKFLENFL